MVGDTRGIVKRFDSRATGAVWRMQRYNENQGIFRPFGGRGFDMDLRDPMTIVLLTAGFLLLGRLAMMLVIGGGSLSRYFQGQGVALRYLRDKDFEAKVNAILTPPPPEPVKPNPDPILILSLLQREGRLVDFLMEDISGASNEQIGAGVREIHRGSQKALQEHVALVPVIDKEEMQSVEVKPGFDPSAIRLTGNVTGQPPFRGTLQHRGWRVKEVKLQRPPEGQDAFVVQPAEVELP